MARISTSESARATAPDSVGVAGIQRPTRSRRGEARRRDLLERVTDDLVANGLVDFSLRRAARAADTTHKVLLYHFTTVENLLEQAMVQVRARRIEMSLAASADVSATFADRIMALWPSLWSAEARVLHQATGLAIYDPGRYARLTRDGTREYLVALRSLCPDHWSEQQQSDVSHMVLAAVRGLIVEQLTSNGDLTGVEAGLRGLRRALEREESDGPARVCASKAPVTATRCPEAEG
ncbi:TetR/AcrR family transcriptional regulator [Nocardia sp. NPDC058705]|uniref:TetR/AcrR family transcriptional regulator n=1 Tax=Nocardia sp. NPDC058705 TaxID=3346609 RepID=UPI0036B875A3